MTRPATHVLKIVAAATAAVAIAACSGKPAPFEPDPAVVAEVNALLASDEAILRFVEDDSSNPEQLERFVRGAPDEVTSLTIRACQLLAAREGAALLAGRKEGSRGFVVGRLLRLLRAQLQEHARGARLEHLRASYGKRFGELLPPGDVTFSSKRDFAAAVVDMHIKVAHQSFWAARDPNNLRETQRTGPELDEMEHELRYGFNASLSTGLSSH